MSYLSPLMAAFSEELVQIKTAGLFDRMGKGIAQTIGPNKASRGLIPAMPATPGAMPNLFKTTQGVGV